MIPVSSQYVVVGAGIHGLSTAYHLAGELEARGAGSGADIVVLDKARPGAGASGIACGVVRNNYFQPAMSELMQACVEVWESDAAAYHYNPVGYIALGPKAQESDLVAVFERQERIGYRSELIVGESAVTAHMRKLFPDWRARGVTVCLHEHQGGFAFNQESVQGLVDKCTGAGVSVLSGVEVTGIELGAGDVATAVETDHGRIAIGEQLVIAPGPWAQHFWRMLGLPDTIDVRTPAGDVRHDVRMWTYWNLQEGEITVDPLMFATADGGAPPVIHLDTDAPLTGDDGKLVTDELWGIYFKRDRHGVQGGASPLTVDGDVQLDPYPSTTDVDPGFPDMWCAALSHAMARFEGCRPLYKQARSGGVGSFSADNFPVFDYLKPNVYAILDSNHGYKMIGVGREVAKVLQGEHSSLLYPFRFERFATGDLHPVSNSPYPWS
ncbi:FAD dependent oxidoreductase [Gaiella occulta]|uniref:FAD dependent oxidoreductase n=1 Tax=Gaiella occulta TaxID=1002870 RepID=A0A7M2Z135_9ACTN|nr:FAD-binding oxidoreductase [Gaiella occulta]RDI76118.1 FAD dependent oxidoreductase [Gaiella occulta]